jgi:stage IV sporulation protein FB
MIGPRVSLCPGFVLLAAALYFAGGAGALLALAAAVLAHELGHLVTLYLLGGHVSVLRLRAGGPVIEYSAPLTVHEQQAVVAAGPLAGLLFAVLCIFTGRPFFLYAGAVSMLATAFNMLPALPLDGGRLMQSILEEMLPGRMVAIIICVAGNLCALGVTLTGVYARSAAAAAMGIWLAVLVNVPRLR